MQEVYTLEQIKQIVTPIAQKHNVRRLSIFGSYARNEANADSDVDICIDAPNMHGLFALGALYADLEDALGKEIDLVTERSLTQHSDSPLHQRFAQNLRKDARIVYECD